MRRSACYFPIVPNKIGEIKAVGHLSPRTRARTRIVLEIDRPGDGDAAKLEEHIAGAARQISEAWGTTYPLLVDMPEYGPDHRATNGSTLIEHPHVCLRQLGMLAVPVAGPVSAGGPEILETVRDIARHERRGAALRIPFLELSHVDILQRELTSSMRILAHEPAEIDLLLDLEAVLHIPEHQRSTAHLTAVVHEALALVRQIGEFRNVILCGSSVPENVGKQYNGAPYRGRRIELDVWRTLLPDAIMPVSFSDNGITPSRGPDPRGFGPAPARIRLSTPDEIVFYRANQKRYVDLCKRALSSTDFDDRIPAWGATKLRECARGHIAPSSPTEWVARDTNLHIETTVAEVQRRLHATGRIRDYRFPEEEKFAWLQHNFLEDEQV